MTFTEVITEVLTVGPQVIGVAAVIAAVTPTPADDGVVAVLRKILDMLAFNFGQAKNAKKEVQ